ncbi:hypothetical protein P280DRAFT_505448 [Massarina eburnea CBS 473.64]|uniref:Uncharacterized protein n=1 Tax=Massarina eburnea CBS 473.64 TaxID=1395130 RepID=A0A6A6S6T2_9PLEO|nr:hypothetical protein P280DRAFT_505448 [Massarina eburnea CBS 473.64]
MTPTSSTTITFDRNQSSYLTRTMSPLDDSRSPPCTPRSTAKLSTRFSSDTVLGIIKSYDPHSSPRVPCPSPPVGVSPRFDFGFNSSHKVADSTSDAAVAICRTCQQPIPSSPGVCERCKQTIILPSPSGVNTPASSPPKWKTHRPSSTSVQLVDPPIRLSSLRPPPKPRTDSPRSSHEGSRSRKASLTDPNEPFLRLQISRKPDPLPTTHPSTPTTPPSTSHARPFSPTNSSTPLTRIATIANMTTARPSTRHTSATPSELSTMYPDVASSATTSPPSVSRASYQLQHTTSAWDDWDSEEEEEKSLVKYWRGRRWRSSRGSLGGQGSGGSRRDSEGKDEGKKRRVGGFVRVISCGCAED